MADLPAYSGPRGNCPKCGASGVQTAYQPPHPSGLTIVRGGGREHLLRTCPNCRYDWLEACAEAGEGTTSSPAADEERERPGVWQAGPAAPDLTAAVRAFDLLEWHALRLDQGWSLAAEGPPPVVGYTAQLPLCKRQLDELGRLNIMNCPDTEWVLKLGGALSEARRRLKAVDRALSSDPPGSGRPVGRLAGTIEGLTSALHAVRQLLTGQPGTAEGRAQS